jgi:ribosomal protein S18 acetylase RimI-like enzyme
MEILKINNCEEAFWPKLATFFEDIKSNQYFQPHSFDWDTALELIRYQGPDDYYVAVDRRHEIFAYGFLRGYNRWADVCLGVIVHPRHYRKGFGELMCQHLHCIGRLRNLKRIRLHVHKDNVSALKLYEKLGYKQAGIRMNGEIVCFKNLQTTVIS